MIAILEKYEHNTDFHQIMDFVEASHLRQYTRRARIAQSSALLPIADEPASPIGDDSQGEACPTDSGLEAKQDRENITKTSTLPNDSTPRVTSLAADEGSMQQQLTELTDLVKLLEDRDGGGIAQSREDAPIKGRSLDEREETAVERSTERGSDDTEEMVTVLTSLDAASILTSGVSVSISPIIEVSVAEVPTGSGSIPTTSPPGTGVPTGSGVVLTASPIFTTATVATPYTRRKGKEKMVESDTSKKKKLQEQVDVQMARQNNETVAKYLQEYQQFAAELPIGRRIELISDLVKYQDNYEKVLKYETQQRKPLSRKQQRKFYISVLRSHAGWKTGHFKGMTLEEIKEKFDPVWKKIEDFIPIGSKEEGERFKRKRLRLEQDNAKKVKTSEEVSKEDLKDMMQLVPVEEVYVEALQLWALVKVTLNIRQAVNDKEKELWVKLKRLFESDVEDQL
nr:hypothetical protein [Tanacetum cinerariifolium]